MDFLWFFLDYGSFGLFFSLSPVGVCSLLGFNGGLKICRCSVLVLLLYLFCYFTCLDIVIVLLNFLMCFCFHLFCLWLGMSAQNGGTVSEKKMIDQLFDFFFLLLFNPKIK